MTWHPWDGEHWHSSNGLMCFGPPNHNLEARGCHEDVPPTSVPRWIKLEGEGGARLDCCSMVKKPKVRHTRKAGPRGPRLEVMVQRRCRSIGKMGRHHNGRALMDMSAALSIDNTCKDSRAASV